MFLNFVTSFFSLQKGPPNKEHPPHSKRFRFRYSRQFWVGASYTNAAAMQQQEERDIHRLSRDLTKFEVMKLKEIHRLDPEKKKQFFKAYSQICHEAEHLGEHLSDEHSDSEEEEGDGYYQAKRMKPEPLFAGDKQPLDEVSICPVYEVMKSNRKGATYQYVNRCDGSGTKRWQAQPYLKGYGNNGRWNAGYYSTARIAARAVAVATAHRCHQQRVLELMEKIPHDRYKEI